MGGVYLVRGGLPTGGSTYWGGGDLPIAGEGGVCLLGGGSAYWGEGSANWCGGRSDY